MTLLSAAQTALTELERIHQQMGACKSPVHCPTATAINNLREALDDNAKLREAFKIDEAAEATYPPMHIADLDQDAAHAILRAQQGLEKSDTGRNPR